MEFRSQSKGDPAPDGSDGLIEQRTNIHSLNMINFRRYARPLIPP
jgi:hypothetical protein